MSRPKFDSCETIEESVISLATIALRKQTDKSVIILGKDVSVCIHPTSPRRYNSLAERQSGDEKLYYLSLYQLLV